MNRAALSMALVLVAGCGGTSVQTKAVIGSQGGALRAGEGAQLIIPAGALEKDVEVSLTDDRGTKHVVILEPRGLELGKSATLEVQVEGKARPMEVDGRGKKPMAAHPGANGALEVEIEHFAEVEFEDAACDPACDPGFECEDRTCVADDRDAPDGGRRDDGAAACVPACDAGFKCDDGACVMDDRGDHGGATTPPGTCVTDDDCGSCGGDCVAGACAQVTPCTSSADCAAGLECKPAVRRGTACGFDICQASSR